MADSIPDLWSDDIRVDVVTPAAILRAQAGFLSKKTQGILEALVSSTAAENQIIHSLDLLAPSLGRYRETVLTATHAKERAYPVRVTAECFHSTSLSPESVPARNGPPDGSRDAFSQDVFVTLVGNVLQSGEVRSLINSLIARSNEISNPQTAVEDAPA